MESEIYNKLNKQTHVYVDAYILYAKTTCKQKLLLV